jgi:hypothetical protein
MTNGSPAKNPHAIAREKEGRNSPCPCGSKLKYKKCCLKKIENSIQLKITISRSIKKKIQEIHSEYFKDKISLFAFSKRISVTDDSGDYLYRYRPSLIGEDVQDLILVRMTETKIIVEELIRNGKTYAQYKAEKDSGNAVGSESQGS